MWTTKRTFACKNCKKPLPKPGRGRPSEYCNGDCRYEFLAALYKRAIAAYKKRYPHAKVPKSGAGHAQVARRALSFYKRVRPDAFKRPVHVLTYWDPPATKVAVLEDATDFYELPGFIHTFSSRGFRGRCAYCLNPRDAGVDNIPPMRVVNTLPRPLVSTTSCELVSVPVCQVCATTLAPCDAGTFDERLAYVNERRPKDIKTPQPTYHLEYE